MDKKLRDQKMVLNGFWAHTDYENHFILVKSSQLEISWKFLNTKLLASSIPSCPQAYYKITTMK